MAAGRALGAREPDESIRNPDYLAERLLGPEERAMVADQAVVQALDQDFADAPPESSKRLASVIMMIIRTRFIEERLEQAIRDGVSQLVILGAGFDTRAYRLMELLKAARVFEVDQPSTQEYKKRRVREAGIEVPPNLTYVPVDFRHDKLGDVLTAAGYDSQPKDILHLGRRHHVSSRSGGRRNAALGGGAGSRQHHHFRFRGRDAHPIYGDGGFEQVPRSRPESV